MNIPVSERSKQSPSADPLHTKPAAEARDAVFFDGQCGWCRTSVRILRALDWGHRLRFVDYLTLAEHEQPTPPGVFMTGLPLRTRDGRVLIGYDAARRALVQTPLGVLFGWPLYLPGVRSIGRQVYRRIAARRPRACVAPQRDSDLPPQK